MAGNGSESSKEELNQGWTQLTDRGRIYVAKKEKNVFVLEGTANAGVSACGYVGSKDERTTQEKSEWGLLAEVKVVPDS